MHRLFTFLLFICTTVTLSGQEYYELYYQSKASDSELPFKLQTRVQNLEDFISRFNGYQNAYGETLDSSDPKFRTIRSNDQYWKTWRRNVIGSLMKPRLYAKDSSQNYKFIKALETIDRISMGSSQLSAFLPVEVLVSGSEMKCIIELKFIALNNDRYEWVIHDVITPSKDEIPPSKIDEEMKPVRNPNVFLPPNAHGNGFLQLQREVKEHESMSPYFREMKQSFIVFQTLLHRSSSISFEPVYYRFKSDQNSAFYVNDEFFIYDVDLP